MKQLESLLVHKHAHTLTSISKHTHICIFFNPEASTKATSTWWQQQQKMAPPPRRFALIIDGLVGDRWEPSLFAWKSELIINGSASLIAWFVSREKSGLGASSRDEIVSSVKGDNTVDAVHEGGGSTTTRHEIDRNSSSAELENICALFSYWWMDLDWLCLKTTGRHVDSVWDAMSTCFCIFHGLWEFLAICLLVCFWTGILF